MSKCAGIVFVFAVIVCIAGCGNNDPGAKASKTIEEVVKEKAVDSDDVEVKQEVRNFRLEGFSKTGQNRWAVHGEFANIVDPDIILKSIHGKSFSKDLCVTLSADKGVYNKGTRSAELTGNVVIMLSDGGRALMDYAKWNAGEEVIETDSAIRIEHSGIILEGIGAIVKPQLEWALVKTQITMSDTNGRVITCDGPLEVAYKEKKAILNNNVEITDKDGKIYADKVVAYFDPEKKSIERIEWLGNVKAVY